MRSFFQFFLITVLIMPTFLRSAPAHAEEKGRTHETLIQSCIELSAKKYSLPSEILQGVYKVEGGKIGGKTALPNGSEGLGPMNIDVKEIPNLSSAWAITEEETYNSIKNDPCSNTSVLAHKFRTLLEEKKSYSSALEELGQYKRGDKDVYKKAIYAIAKKRPEGNISKASPKHWMLLIYEYDTLIEEPIYIESLDSCLIRISKLDMEHRTLTRRHQCLNFHTGEIYTTGGVKIKDRWSREFPKKLQIGKIAPWVAWSPESIGLH